MFRKMILAFAVVMGLAAWASAKPGTWGKERPGDEAQARQPGAGFHQWLNAFSAAYEQRDGEKMDELLKRFEGAKAEFPAAPRLEKWMGNVKEAYDAQDIQKMGRLLDNAEQMGQRMRVRMGEHRMGRNERNGGGFGPKGRPMHRPEGDFRNREFGPHRDIDGRAYGQNRGQDFDRPNRMGPHNPMAPEGRMQRMGDRRSMDSDRGPEGFAGGRFREQSRRDDTGPRMRNQARRPQFDNDLPADRMRPSRRSFEDSDRPSENAAPFGRRDFQRQGYGPRTQRPQYEPYNENTRDDFWD